MNKILLVLIGIIFLSVLNTYADDNGLWDNYSDYGSYNSKKQTAVSDEQFEKTLEKVKENKNKGFFSIIFKKRQPKGDKIQESNETEFLQDINKELPVLLIPCELLTNNGEIIPIGHYQAVFEKNKENNLVMKLYQAHSLINIFPALETEEDLYDEHLNYIKLCDYNENMVKINYGSMDFNAVVYIKKNIQE